MHRHAFLLLSLPPLLLGIQQCDSGDDDSPTPDVTPTPTYDNTGSPLGTNLSGIVDWSTEYTFVDAFKASRSWITQCANGQQPDCTGQWDTGESAQLDLDEYGWVRSLPAPSDAPIYWYVSTLLLRDLQGHYPAGQYVVLYDGTGTLEYSFDARKNASLSAPGRDVLDVTPSSGGILLTLKATDPAGTGDYLRNIRVLMPGQEATYQQEPFHPTFLSAVSPYRTLRFMDWMRTNGSSQQAWENRPVPLDARYATDGVPVEVMVDLANRVHAEPWFNMPHLATDEYALEFARTVAERLDPSLTVVMEYSNEIWNTAFSQGSWVEAQGQAAWPESTESGYTKRMNWYGKRTAELCELWRQAFGAQAYRVQCVMGAQAANAWTASAALDCPLWEEAPCVDHGIDAVAIAPYFGNYLGSPSYEAQVEAWTAQEDGGLNALFTELRTGQLLDGGPGVPALDTVQGYLTPYVTLGETYGVDIVAYEGGQHLVGYGGVENNTAITGLLMAANRDSRMGELYTDYLNLWRDNHLGTFAHFTSCGLYSKWGSWGANEFLDTDPMPKTTALQTFIERNPCWWAGCR